MWKTLREEPLRMLVLFGGAALGAGLLLTWLGIAVLMAPTGQGDAAGAGMERAFYELLLFATGLGATTALGTAWGALKPSWWGLGVAEALGAALLLTAPAMWFVVRNLLQDRTYWLPEESFLVWLVGIGLGMAFAARSVFSGWKRGLLAPLPLLLVPVHPLTFVLPEMF